MDIVNIVDSKFNFRAINEANGNEVTHLNGMVFKASDNAIIPMLDSYLRTCVKNKCDPKQIECVQDLIRRVGIWRANNPDLCKNADVTPKEAAMILGQPF